MVKCPRCETEINYLRNYTNAEVVYRFYLDDNGRPEYDHIDTILSPDSEFECPSCNQVLFTLESEAVAFLKGG